MKQDFPGGPVVKSLPTSAGDVGSAPDQGTKIPHAMAQLNPCAATTEVSTHLEPVLSNARRSLCTVLKSSPYSPQLAPIAHSIGDPAQP